MRLSVVIAVACISMVGLSVASDASASVKRQTAIATQGLGPALQQLASERDVQFVYRSEVVGDRQTSGASGDLNFEQALMQLLEGTGLTYRFLGETAITIIPIAGTTSLLEDAESPVAGRNYVASSMEEGAGGPNSASATAAGAPMDLWPRFRLAQVDQERSGNVGQSGTPGVIAEGQSSAQLEEILVTAQKREQTVLDVPLSVSTLSSQEINVRGLAGMSDYLNTVPGVTMLDKGVARNAIIFRGISTDPEFEGLFTGSPAVGIYFGDVPLAVTTLENSPDVKLVDMQRVEVLRGPQGTLFGSGSLSGTVRNIPNAPNLERFEGLLRANYSLTDTAGDGNYMVQGVLNIPVVTDRFAIRVVGYHYENGGYVNNVAGDDARTVALAEAAGLPEIAVSEKDVGDDNYSGGRFSALWQVTDNFDVEVTYLKQKLEQNGFPEVELNRPDSFEQTRFDISSFVPGGERLADDLDVASLALRYQLPRGYIYSSSSWVTLDSIDNHDVRQLFTPGTLLGDTPLPQGGGQETDAFTQEFRFVSEFDGPMQLIAGVYYEDVDQTRFANTAWGFGDPSLNPFPDEYLLLFNLDTDLEQVALFGEVSYTWNDRVTLTVGARAFDYERQDVDTRGGTFGTGASTPLSIDEQDNSFKAILSYTPNENVRTYLQWAEGFRLGRGNLPIPEAICDANGDGVVDGTSLTLEQVSSLQSDALENLELGAKFLALEKKLSVNLALYEVTWDNVPFSIVPPCGFGVTPNAGTARVRGVELDGSFLLTEALRLDFATSYKDGELRSVVDGVPAEPGDRLPGSADFNFSAGLQYDFPLGSHRAFVRGDYNHVGGYYNNFQEAGVETGNYHLGNLRFGVGFGRVNVELFVNNVTNDDGLTWNSLSFFADQRGIRLRPRTIGIETQFSF